MVDKDLISRQALLEAYDREHEGSPGMARRLIQGKVYVCPQCEAKNRRTGHRAV